MSNSILQFVFVYRESFRRSVTTCYSPNVLVNRFSSSTKHAPRHRFSTFLRNKFHGQSVNSKDSILLNSWNRCFRHAKDIFNDRMLVITGLFTKQFHAIVAQRIRRTAQIMLLYKNLGYDHELVKKVVEKIAHSFLKKNGNKSLSCLLGAAFFTWEKERISDDELYSVADEISYVRGDKETQSPDIRLDSWEKVLDKGPVSIWRKPVPNSYLYEYKVFGTYHDIPARAFFSIQVDLEFRKQWDKLVISLDVIDKDEESGSEIVRWVTHFPYPMYSREYIYKRKYKVDHDKMLMVIVNKNVDYPSLPSGDKYVRVNTYMSQMVIRPHTSFDENGFDYVLTYYDDPQAAFPTFAYNWMANTGVPDFVDKLHTAAMKLQEKKKGVRKDEQPGVDGRLPDKLPM